MSDQEATVDRRCQQSEHHASREAVLVLSHGRAYCSECAHEWAAYAEARFAEVREDRDWWRAKAIEHDPLLALI